MPIPQPPAVARANQSSATRKERLEKFLEGKRPVAPSHDSARLPNRADMRPASHQWVREVQALSEEATAAVALAQSEVQAANTARKKAEQDLANAAQKVSSAISKTGKEAARMRRHWNASSTHWKKKWKSCWRHAKRQRNA